MVKQDVFARKIKHFYFCWFVVTSVKDDCKRVDGDMI